MSLADKIRNKSNPEFDSDSMEDDDEQMLTKNHRSIDIEKSRLIYSSCEHQCLQLDQN